MPQLGLPKLSHDPVLFLPLWLGTLRDRSGHGNHPTQLGGYWDQSGNVDGTRNARLALTADASLNPSDITIAFWGDIRSQITSEYVIVTVDFATRLRITNTQLELASNGVSSTRNASIIGSRFIAVTATGASAEPIFYVDGISIGAGNNVVSFNAGLQNWLALGVVGIEVLSPVSGLMLYPGALPAPEIAELHAYSQSLITPRKQWPGGGLRYPDRGDPYVPATGDPMYIDNIQSARVTLADQTSGKLSNTPYQIESGTWRLAEDATTGERYIECVVAGIISRRNLEAYGTWEFDALKANASIWQTVFISSDKAATASDYILYLSATEQVGIFENIVAFMMQSVAGYIAEGGRYRYRVTRSAVGEFSLYVIGGAFAVWTLVDVSGGSGTNPKIDISKVASLYCLHDLDAGDRLYADRQFAGVLAP